MAIITLDPLANETLDQKKLRHKAIISGQMTQSFMLLKNQFNAIFKQVWQNKDLTPQQIFDSFGTDAAQLFLIAGTIQQAMNTIVPDSVTQAPPSPYTIHPDGTVTVGS